MIPSRTRWALLLVASVWPVQAKPWAASDGAGVSLLPKEAPAQAALLAEARFQVPPPEGVALKAATADGLELSPSAVAGGPLKGRSPAPPGTEWVVIFYRTVGEEEFSSFNLAVAPDGSFAGSLEQTLPPGTKLQYYAALRTPAGIKYLPKEAPAVFATLQLPGDAAAPGSTPAVPSAAAAAALAPPVASGIAPPPAPPYVPGQGPIALDASVGDQVHHRVVTPGEQRLTAAGQMRLTYRQDEGDSHLFMSTRLVYTDQPMGTQTRWGLGEIQASYTKGPQKLAVGDMMVQESEFTLAGAGRRGADYAYAGQQLGAHLFALGTQPLVGTRGLLWPVEGKELYGGSLGYGWLNNNVRAKLVFLTGKDDPSLSTNLVSALPPAVREGSTGALVVDGRFLDSRLTISGEYARSLYTRDVAAVPTKDSDHAWRLSSLYSQGAFSAQVGYRDVGREYGTVGVAFFVGDRRVLDGSVGFNYQTWSVSATALDERTNPTGQAGLNQAWNRSQGLDARLALTQSVFWRVGLRQARQEAEVVANPLVPFSNSERTGITTGFDLVLPPGSTLTLNVQLDDIKATGATATTGSGTTISLGGSLAFGTWLRLSPNLSWARTLSDPGDQRTTVSNAFLNADFVIIPNVFGLLLNGGGSKLVSPTGESTLSATAEGTLRFTLDSFLRGRGKAVLGLKGSYMKVPVLGQTTSDSRFTLLLNVSF